MSMIRTAYVSSLIAMAMGLVSPQATPGTPAPPETPNEADEQTLLLYHFDSQKPLADAGTLGGDLEKQGKPEADIQFADSMSEAFGEAAVFGQTNSRDSRRLRFADNTLRLPTMNEFTLELWFRLDAEAGEGGSADGGKQVLLDSLYAESGRGGDRGFALMFRDRFDSNLKAELRVGDHDGGELYVTSAPLLNYKDAEDPDNMVTLGEWHHLTITFQGDGESEARVEFLVDGEPAGEGTVGVGKVESSSHALSIGNRVNAGFLPFQGAVDAIRLSSRVRAPSAMERSALEPRFPGYRRGQIATVDASHLGGAKEVVFRIAEQEIGKANVTAGRARLTFDTSGLSRGTHKIDAHALNREGDVMDRFSTELVIGPPADPHRYELWRWMGFPENPDAAWWAERGVTGLRAGWTITKPLNRYGGHQNTLDRYIPLGLDGQLHLNLRKARLWDESHEAWPVGVDGEPYEKAHQIYPAHLDLLAHGIEIARAVGAHLGKHPALRQVHLNSEMETELAFNEVIREKARVEAGIDDLADAWQVTTDRQPSGLAARYWPRSFHWGERYRHPNPTINEDDLRFRVIDWWWNQGGSGLRELNRRMSDTLKRYNADLVTWNDPYRHNPPLNAQRGVDMVASWPYGFPDIRWLLYVKVMNAAGDHYGKQVMGNITTLVKSHHAIGGEDPLQNRMEDFAGRYRFTAGPDYMTEAMWLMLSQRPDKLSFYYDGGPVKPGPDTDPFISSHPDTWDAMGEVGERLLKPLGPALGKTERPRGRVAVLLSQSALWFATSGTRAPKNTVVMPYVEMLALKDIPHDVVLDPQVVEGALEHYDVLVIPRGDTLAESVADGIRRFAARGGRVLADHRTRLEAPHLTRLDYDLSFIDGVSGFRVDSDNFVPAHVYRRRMATLADQLYEHLSDIKRPAFSDSHTALVNELDGGAARYVMVVNDERDYGPRFGEWQVRLERGIEQRTRLTLRGTEPNTAIYDAIEGTQLTEVEREDGLAHVALTLPAARGAMVVALPRPIGAPRIDVSQRLAFGEQARIRVRAAGDDGSPLEAVIPYRITITRPDGVESDWSCFCATDRDGQVSQRFVPAIDAPAGQWEIEVTELLSGQSRSVSIEVGD